MRTQVLIFGIILLLGLTSCMEKQLEINFDEQIDSLPVLRGFITNSADSVPILLTWTESSDEFGFHFEKIQNVSIKLFENDNYVTDLTTNMNKDYYVAHFHPEENRVYSIQVSIEDWKDTLFAQTFIPKHGKIKALDSRVIITTDDFGIEYFIQYRLRIIDPDSTQMNYFALGYMPANAMSFNDLRFMVIDDPILGQWDELDIASRNRKKFFLFTDENFEDSIDFDVRVWFNRYDHSRCDTPQIRFYLLTLSPEAYKDFQSYNNIQGEEIWDIPIGAFSEPILIYSNVENGLGAFVGFSGDTTSVITEVICD